MDILEKIKGLHYSADAGGDFIVAEIEVAQFPELEDRLRNGEWEDYHERFYFHFPRNKPLWIDVYVYCDYDYAYNEFIMVSAMAEYNDEESEIGYDIPKSYKGDPYSWTYDFLADCLKDALEETDLCDYI